jgi:hypothetical protein
LHHDNCALAVTAHGPSLTLLARVARHIP